MALTTILPEDCGRALIQIARASALSERKGIVAHKNARAGKLEGDIAGGKVPRRSESICDAEDQARCVDSIGGDGGCTIGGFD